MKWKLLAGAFVVFAGSTAFADCMTDYWGNVVCGTGACTKDYYGNVTCVQGQGGSEGAGECLTDYWGNAVCSSPGGSCARQNDGHVVCS